jgi:hypothetical protein
MQSRTCVIRASGDETDHLFQIERRCLQPRRRPTSSYLCPSHHTSVKKSSQRRLILPQISSTCVLAYVLCPLPLSLSALIPRLAVHLQFLLPHDSPSIQHRRIHLPPRRPPQPLMHPKRSSRLPLPSHSLLSPIHENHRHLSHQRRRRGPYELCRFGINETSEEERVGREVWV